MRQTFLSAGWAGVLAALAEFWSIDDRAFGFGFGVIFYFLIFCEGLWPGTI